MGIGLLINGVHGSGKTTLSRYLEKLGFERINGDAAEHYKDRIVKMDPYLRETLFLHYNFAAFSLLIDNLRLNINSTLDPSPLTTIPYVKFFLNEKGSSLLRKINNYYNNLIEYIKNNHKNSVTLIHVGLIAESKADISIIINRLKKRKGRKELKKEEINENYISFINKEIIRILKNLEKKGERVLMIPATLGPEKQAEIIMNYLEKNKLI